MSCNDVLVGGTHTLTANLDCTGDEPAILTVQDGAVLDLQGFSLIFHNPGSGVIMTGQGATLRNGVIVPPSDIPVWLMGTGGHLVEDMDIMPTPYQAFWVQSHNNTIQHNYTEGPFVSYQVDGNDNKILNNTSWGSDVIAYVTGTRNTIRGHQGSNDYSGFYIEGNNNLITENTLGQAAGVWVGISVSGVGNVITRNTLGFFELDAEDSHGNCTTNYWQHNLLNTADPSCILQGSESVRSVFGRR